MGVYDILPKGSQVKCWKCEMRHLDVGDKVGKLNGYKDYIVLLREGGYVIVTKKKISLILEDSTVRGVYNETLPVFDKYGNEIHSMGELKGLLGENYYYE